MTTTTTGPEKMEFKTELKQLLDLIIHSLYTKKEIFLRELISNAADAIDKVRFESLTNAEVLEGNSDWKIKLIADESAGTLTVSDNGVGMSREEIVHNLGTIARSGTKAFLEKLKASDAAQRPELIGQFGVGFYSSFMVADRVTVVSRPAGPASAGVKWESDGQGEFSVEAIEKPTRGTDVTLHLREGEKEILTPLRLRQIVKQYSDFIEHPIVLDIEEEKDGVKDKREDTLNSRQAIWLRGKSEVKPEEYVEFYKQISRDFDAPAKTIHIAAEGGATEFRALLFFPSHRPMEWMMPDQKYGPQLYVRRVLIMHECPELLPPYLRFVKGVVDSSDLPLNVSRETLQHNPLLAKIRTNLVNRILKTLGEMKNEENEAYLKFYKEFGPVLKEGVAHDWSNREKVADLLLFESTKTEPGKFTTLEQVAAAAGETQKEIYYLIGETRGQIENSPYLESFKSRGQEVLLLTDPVDEFFVQSLGEYKGKKLKAVDKGEMPADDASAEQLKAESEKYKALLDALKGKLDTVKEVRLSARLKESAACLVADESAMSAHMERLMKRIGRGEDFPGSKRILELNPTHPAVQALQTLHASNPSDDRVEAFGRLLYDQAVIAEGSKIEDPAGFAKRINALIAQVTTAAGSGTATAASSKSSKVE